MALNNNFQLKKTGNRYLKEVQNESQKDRPLRTNMDLSDLDQLRFPETTGIKGFISSHLSFEPGTFEEALIGYVVNSSQIGNLARDRRDLEEILEDGDFSDSMIETLERTLQLTLLRISDLVLKEILKEIGADPSVAPTNEQQEKAVELMTTKYSPENILFL
jgi:hypothetical protein